MTWLEEYHRGYALLHRITKRVKKIYEDNFFFPLFLFAGYILLMRGHSLVGFSANLERLRRVFLEVANVSQWGTHS